MKHIFISLFAFASVGASAAEVLGCDYLTNAAGINQPGLSRPQVVVSGNSAEVTVYLEGGGGLSARRSYILSAGDGLYADANGNTLTRGDRYSTLSLFGLTATCSR